MFSILQPFDMEQFLYKNISFTLRESRCCIRKEESSFLTEIYPGPLTVPENIENQQLKLSGFIGTDFIKLSEDGCDMYNRQTRAFLLSNKKSGNSSSSLKMRQETTPYYCLNSGLQETTTSHLLFVYRSPLKVNFVVFFDVVDKKTIVIRNILSECSQIDETEILQVFNLFFKNKCERIVIRKIQEGEESHFFLFDRFLFLGKENLFYRDMMELDNNNINFSQFNQALKNAVEKVKKFEEEYNALQIQSRNDFPLHAARFDQIKTFPAALQNINNYVSKYTAKDKKYDIRVNAKIAVLEAEREHDIFLFDFTGGNVFENTFIKSIIQNICLRNCFYIYRQADEKKAVKIFSLNRNFVLFTVFLREIDPKYLKEILEQIKNNNIVSFDENNFCDNVKLYIYLFKYIFEIGSPFAIINVKKMGDQA